MRVSDLMARDFFVVVGFFFTFIYLFRWNLVNNLFDLIALRGKWANVIEEQQTIKKKEQLKVLLF